MRFPSPLAEQWVSLNRKRVTNPARVFKRTHYCPLYFGYLSSGRIPIPLRSGYAGRLGGL